MLSTFTKIENKLSLNDFLFKCNFYDRKARHLNYNINLALTSTFTHSVNLF